MYKFLLLVVISTTTAEFTYENDVVVLTDSNFEEALDTFQYVFLDFYAPWCQHCKEFQPEYEQLAKDLKEDGIILAKVDAIEHRKLADAQNVKAYPTLKFINQHKEFPYDGARTYDSVKSFIYKHINPGTEELQSIEAITEFVTENPIVFFYFADTIPKNSKDRQLRRFIEFSYSTKNAVFAHTHLKEARAHFKAPTQFVAFKNGQVIPYSSELKHQEMKNFVELVPFDRIVEEQLVQDRMFKKATIFSFNEQDYGVLEEVAKEHLIEDYLLFVRVENKEKIREELQIKQNDAEGVFIINGDQKFKQNQCLQTTKENIKKFISQWKQGKASKYAKTQDVPQQNDGPVKIIVGQNYGKEVLESDKDVVVLYYDSKKEEHKNILNQYENVAQRLQKNDLKMCRIDCNENEIEDMSDSVEVVKIRFYKGDEANRQKIKFILKANKLQEERLVKWIRENASGEIIEQVSDL